MNRDDLELAKAALAALDVVLVTDMMDEAFAWLLRCLLPRRPDVALVRNKANETVNNDTAKFDAVTPKLVEWARQRNALDYELVEWARRRLRALISTTGTRMPSWCDHTSITSPPPPKSNNPTL